MNSAHCICSSCDTTCNHKKFDEISNYKNFLSSESVIYTNINRNRSDIISTGFLKIEPYGPSSSPESVSEHISDSFLCGGCKGNIHDRYYLSAVEKRWHAGCLQCFACKTRLDGETSCFSRDNNIYCKKDYYRYFGTKRCSRCLASISSSEFVMRAKNLVFHLSCFSCAICELPLTKGDQFGIRDSAVFCRTHFEHLDEQTHLTKINTCKLLEKFRSSQTPSPADCQKNIREEPALLPHSGFSNFSQPPRQKGRPRKRKPKDIEALATSLEFNTEYLTFGRSNNMSSSSRTKRMRTSFKHHQLRTMKSYFAINHNPDAKDLKQLSQKTGLPKRVLQVWFQNARAKWRRMMIKHDATISNNKIEASIDLESYTMESAYVLNGPSDSPSLE